MINNLSDAIDVIKKNPLSIITLVACIWIAGLKEDVDRRLQDMEAGIKQLDCRIIKRERRDAERERLRWEETDTKNPNPVIRSRIKEIESDISVYDALLLDCKA